MDFFRKSLTIIWDVFESSVMAMAMVVVTYLFFFQPGQVRGNSSFPTWQEEDRFITQKFGANPHRGDFVVIQSPQNADVDFIKRIVGLPGEAITLKSCQVYINSTLLSEPYLQPGTCTGPDRSYFVPINAYFLMGDNRSGSSDSRSFGPIPQSSIVGKVIFRYWPLDRKDFIH